VLLPDGQIRYASNLVYTDEPFRPATADEVERQLLAGPYKDFHVLRTAHYVVFYQSSLRFAEASARLLEDLYKGLTEALRKREVPIHEAEFPLVVVIYRSEKDFRAKKPVAPTVQACYEIHTNQIFFYESSERDKLAPELSTVRRLQTVAHEGTHQILSNVGVQPRLSAWPLWLVEGLAEFCSPPVTVRKGRKEAIAWRGLGAVNPFHMATIRDLDDPLSIQVNGSNGPRIGREPGTPLVEYLVTRTELTPTDYALAWALTHYLNKNRGDAFIEFLKTMSRMPPMEERSPEDHLAAFRAAFGQDLAKLDRAIAVHLKKQRYEELPYYAVIFMQPLGGGRFIRSAMVSQSPSVIQQWVERSTSPNGGVPSWEAHRQLNRARAELFIRSWIEGR
jgi:hypothetical protein